VGLQRKYRTPRSLHYHLLQASADPFHPLEIAQGRSVMSMAFQVYTANEPKDRGLATILPVVHCLDQSDLSPLHFAILKITHVSLAQTD